MGQLLLMLIVPPIVGVATYTVLHNYQKLTRATNRYTNGRKIPRHVLASAAA